MEEMLTHSTCVSRHVRLKTGKRWHQRTLQDGRVVNVISMSLVRRVKGKGKGSKKVIGQSEYKKTHRCDQIGNQNVLHSKNVFCLGIDHVVHPGKSHRIKGNPFWFKEQSGMDQSM
eukprot:4138854-Amphidinium_carterae.2